MLKPKIRYTAGEILEKKSNTIFTNPVIEQVVNYIKQEYSEYVFLDKERLRNLERRVSELEKELEKIKETPRDVIIVEEMDMKTAKQKVLEYTEKNKIFDIEELHKNIRCELSLLIEIIDQLKKEGRIIEEK